MNKILFSFSLTLTLSLTLSSCSDFLSQQSQDEVIVKTVTDYSELLLGSGYPKTNGNDAMYNLLYVLDDDYQLMDNVMSDDEDYGSALGARPLYTWQPNMWQDPNLSATYFSDTYATTYERIMGVNAVLDGIDDAQGDEVERDQVKAEALALRAYYYYMLVNIFAQPYCVNANAPGVPLKLNANLQTNGAERSTVGAVYEQIEKDLKESAELFGKYKKRRGSYRINLPCVEILLTRVYLQKEEWDKVVEAAKIAKKNGGALTNYSGASTYESISNYALSEVEWLYGNGYRPCNLSGFGASTALLSMYNSRDGRLKRWFQSGSSNVFKHRLLSSRAPTNAMRISEAYIAAAEAYARLGMTEEALEEYNTLRSKRISGVTPAKASDFATTDDLVKEMLAERRRELCYDEVRWFDLRRLGMPAIEHRYKVRKSDPWQFYRLEEKDPLYTLPIPNTALVQNTNLVQNESASAPMRGVASN